MHPHILRRRGRLDKSRRESLDGREHEGRLEDDLSARKEMNGRRTP
jgi:hypothetical protein